jgi:hypothetical protein
MPCCTRRSASVIALVILTSVGAFIWWNIIEDWRNRPSAEPNYSQVEDGLYIGGSVEKPPPGTRAVLNLCEIEDPYRCEIHAWHKIPDAAPAPSMEWLREQVDFVDKQRRAGVPVYIHCVAGASRAGMVTTAYLMFKNDWTRDDALVFLQKRRPVVNPNPAFMELLLLFEADLSHGVERLKVMPREVGMSGLRNDLPESEGVTQRQLDLLKALDNLQRFAPDDSDLANWKWAYLQKRVIGTEPIEMMPREVK